MRFSLRLSCFYILKEKTMNHQQLEVTIHYRPGVATIDLHGDLTAQAGATLQAAYATVESQNPEVVFFNFAGVDYINSTGIALIISLLKRAQQASCTLMAYGLRPFYAELFEMAGLTD